jgi:hypothetical protein
MFPTAILAKLLSEILVVGLEESNESIDDRYRPYRRGGQDKDNHRDD